MKKWLCAAILVLLAGTFAACTTQPASAPNADATTIVSIGPNITEILMGLGYGHLIVAMDSHSPDIPGVPENIPLLDMFALDIETILMLEPTVVIATEMINWGVDPLELVSRAGIRVVYVPMVNSIADIKESINLVNYGVTLAPYLSPDHHLIHNMQTQINEVRTIAETITAQRTVYFEIDMGPPLFTFSEGSFLQEILELIGAINVFGDVEMAWVSVADEQVLARNPDVILTNVLGEDEALGIIGSRPGWSGLDAVINGRVHSIDTNASSRPSQNIVYAMWEIARAVYPEYFQ